jgi:hypothetical protein
MNRSLMIAFLICQLTGEIASWLGAGGSSTAGPWLWVIGVVFLLPGDIIASWLIERFLWTSSLNLHQLQWIKVPCEILINAVVWVLIALCISRLQRKPDRKAAQ